MRVINGLQVTIKRDHLYQDQTRRFIVEAYFETDVGPIKVGYAKLFDPDDLEALLHTLMTEAEQEITKHLQDDTALTCALNAEQDLRRERGGDHG